MSKRPVSAGDCVLVRLEVTHRLNDGYLIVAGPGVSPITVHEHDVLTVAAVPERHPKARPSHWAAVG
jgi:hypothetical protein